MSGNTRRLDTLFSGECVSARIKSESPFFRVCVSNLQYFATVLNKNVIDSIFQVTAFTYWIGRFADMYTSILTTEP